MNDQSQKSGSAFIQAGTFIQQNTAFKKHVTQSQLYTTLEAVSRYFNTHSIPPRMEAWSWWCSIVCQKLFWRTKNSPHSINI